MKKNIKQILLTLIATSLLGACGLNDYLSPDEVIIEDQPEIILPLAYGTIEMQELVDAIQDEDSLFGQRNNGDIEITYREDDIFSYDVAELIDFDSNIDVGNIEVEVGRISIDYDFPYQMTIEKMINELDGEIDDLADYNERPKAFPAYEATFDPPAEFKVDAIDQFQEANFFSGNLIVEMTNNLPVFGIFVDIDLYDFKNNKTIANFKFGDKDRYEGYDIYYDEKHFDGAKFGLPGSIATEKGSPGAATEQLDTTVAGLLMSNDIGVKLNYIYTDGSGGLTPIINFDDGMFFNLRLENALVESGVFKVPEQTIPGDAKKFDNIELSEGVGLSIVNVKNGILNINFNKTLQIDGAIKLELPGLKRSIDPSNLVINLPFTENKNSYNYSVDIKNSTIDFGLDPTNDFNTLTYDYEVFINKGNNYIEFASTDKFVFDIAIIDFDIESADGNFGQDTIEIEKTDFDLDLAIFDKFNGDITFLNPTINLIITNSISMPLNVNLDLNGYGAEGAIEPLDAEPFVLPYPDYPNQLVITETKSFNNTNSNIVNFLSLPPTEKITFGGKIEMNPDGPPPLTKLNHIEMSGEIGFDLEVIIPAKFSAPELVINDTIKFDGTNLENLASAELRIITENKLPFGVDVELAFIDTTQANVIFGTPVNSDLLNPATVDENGNVTAATSHEASIILQESQVPRYAKANAIKVAATIFTPTDGNPAKLTGSNELSIDVRLKAKVNIVTNTDNE